MRPAGARSETAGQSRRGSAFANHHDAARHYPPTLKTCAVPNSTRSVLTRVPPRDVTSSSSPDSCPRARSCRNSQCREISVRREDGPAGSRRPSLHEESTSRSGGRTEDAVAVPRRDEQAVPCRRQVDSSQCAGGPTRCCRPISLYTSLMFNMPRNSSVSMWTL